MACITVPLKEGFLQRQEKFPWVNWAEAGREETLKRDIFDKYIKTRKLSKEDALFCEKIDWHPVDELPLKEEFIKELKKAEKSPHKKMSLEELDKLLGIKYSGP